MTRSAMPGGSSRSFSLRALKRGEIGNVDRRRREDLNTNVGRRRREGPPQESLVYYGLGWVLCDEVSLDTAVDHTRLGAVTRVLSNRREPLYKLI